MVQRVAGPLMVGVEIARGSRYFQFDQVIGFEGYPGGQDNACKSSVNDIVVVQSIRGLFRVRTVTRESSICTVTVTGESQATIACDPSRAIKRKGCETVWSAGLLENHGIRCECEFAD